MLHQAGRLAHGARQSHTSAGAFENKVVGVVVLHRAAASCGGACPTHCGRRGSGHPDPQHHTQRAFPKAINWNAILDAAKQRAAYGINDWLNLAKLDGGTLNSGVGVLTSGCFNSDLQTLAAEIKSLIEPGAQRETTDGDAAAISRAIAVQVARAWTGRAASLWFLAPLGFPTALVFPGPCMPPMPSAPPVTSLYLNVGLISGIDRLAAA